MHQAVHNLIIIGSGPAGYTAAIYAARAALKPLLFSGLTIGGQLMFTTEVENFPGYPNGITGPELMADLKQQAQRFDARFEYKTVTALDFSGSPLMVSVTDEWYATALLIIATWATARPLGLASEPRLMHHGASA